MSHKMRGILLIGAVLLFLFGVGVSVVQASDLLQTKYKVVMHYFWRYDCSHCIEAKPFLERLEKDYPDLELKRYEIHEPANQELWKVVAAKYGEEPQGTPTFYMGDRSFIGYNEQVAQEVEAAVKECLANGCTDPMTGEVTKIGVDPTDREINVPIFGKINLNNQSLTVSTLLISFVDGFNPCSVWVLSMLMALVVHTGSRKKVFFIGLIFLTVTAAVYAMFIAGLFSVLNILNFVGWIQAVVALVSLVFAIINIKDYFWYKQGISLTISDKEKPGLYQRMRNVVAAGDNMWALAGATVVLAGGVSLVEFSCTAGFPVLWTNLLTAQNVSTMTFILLLLLYMIIYQLDEMVIFGTVVMTLKATRMEEKEGRILKLIGGMLMLALAIVMLINPSIMNDIGNALLIFGAAFGATLLVLLLHRRILPSMGIWIGTEASNKNAKGKRRAVRKAH